MDLLLKHLKKRIAAALKNFNKESSDLKKVIYYMFDNSADRELLINKLISCIGSNPFVLQDEDIQNKKKEYLENKKFNDRLQMLIQAEDENDYAPLIDEARKMGFDMHKLLVRLHFQQKLRSVNNLITMLINGPYFSFDDIVNDLKTIVDNQEISPYIARSVLLTYVKFTKAVAANLHNEKLQGDKDRIIDLLTDIMQVLIEKQVWEVDLEIWKGVVKFLQILRNRDYTQIMFEKVKDKDPKITKALESDGLISK